ncbi:MAG TPA: ABC transporter permease [Candidatus Acidoferrum sp.]|nr:ABC transporter permease [Candidatus Acidoferrum sp.]
MGSRYFIRKVVGAAFTILLIVVLNFVLFRMMPGSPDRILLRNPNVSADAVAAARARWGLDDPLPIQLVDYLESTASGDLGYSFKFHGEQVTDVLIGRLWPTVILFGLGEVLAIIIGLALGAYSGWKRGGPIDYLGNGISLVLYSMPYFVIGILILGVFAIGLHWFPTSGMLTIGGGDQALPSQVLDFVGHLFLPVTTVAIGLIGQYSILMRSSVIETLGEDYVTTARAKGLTSGHILRAHALPNALLPAVTLIAINLGYVIGGAITVEVVFNWPGLGTLTVDALQARDYPVLQGIFLLLSVSVVVANLVADLIYGRLDPRVRS